MQIPPPPPGFQIVGQSSPGAASQTPRIIPGTPRQPSAMDIRADQRADRGDQRAARGEQRQVQSDTNELLRSFMSDPEVRQFRAARVATQSLRALGRSGNPYDDIAMVFRFMNAIEPQGIVREGEQAMARDAAGLYDRIQNYYRQMQTGNALTPVQRGQMLDAAYRLYLERARSYNELAEIHRQRAIEMGIPPAQVGRMFPIATGPRTEDARSQRSAGPAIRVISRRPAR